MHSANQTVTPDQDKHSPRREETAMTLLMRHPLWYAELCGHKACRSALPPRKCRRQEV